MCRETKNLLMMGARIKVTIHIGAPPKGMVNLPGGAAGLFVQRQNRRCVKARNLCPKTPKAASTLIELF